MSREWIWKFCVWCSLSVSVLNVYRLLSVYFVKLYCLYVYECIPLVSCASLLILLIRVKCSCICPSELFGYIVLLLCCYCADSLILFFTPIKYKKSQEYKTLTLIFRWSFLQPLVGYCTFLYLDSFSSVLANAVFFM